MIRLVGAVLLAGGAAFLGFAAAGQLERRVKALRAMIGALERMEREIAFRLTSIPDLLGQLAQDTPLGIRAFFKRCYIGLEQLGEKTLADIWGEALEGGAPDLCREDVQVLHELGSVLGRYDGEEQREALSVARGRLTQCLEIAVEERTRLGRVYGVLGLASGGLLVILLL